MPKYGSYTDKQGRTFTSLVKYAEANNVPISYINKIRRSGRPLNDCLDYKNPTEVTDHHGNVFNSEREMADYYDIEYATYKLRKKKGLPMEDRLYNGRLKRVFSKT